MNDGLALMLTIFSLAVGTVVGFICGFGVKQMDCADEAISDSPRPWWQRAIIEAKARKEAESIK